MEIESRVINMKIMITANYKCEMLDIISKLENDYDVDLESFTYTHETREYHFYFVVERKHTPELELISFGATIPDGKIPF